MLIFPVNVVQEPEQVEIRSEIKRKNSDTFTNWWYESDGMLVTMVIPLKSSEVLPTNANKGDKSESISCRMPVCSRLGSHPVLSRQNLTFPRQSQTKPLNVVLKLQWVQELKSILTSSILSTCISPVSVVAADSKYLDVLLNWLLFAMKAQIPMDTIVIVSFDKTLYNFLKMRSFTTIYVDAETLFDGSILSHRYAKILMIRMSVVRLINHFGHDVIHYDPDAILLKDPWPLFYDHNCESDIIAGRGTYPFDINKEFGVTMCMGSAFFRCSPATGMHNILLLGHTSIRRWPSRRSDTGE